MSFPRRPGVFRFRKIIDKIRFEQVQIEPESGFRRQLISELFGKYRKTFHLAAYAHRTYTLFRSSPAPSCSYSTGRLYKSLSREISMQARTILTAILLSIFSSTAHAQSGTVPPWPELGKLTASDGQTNGLFGYSVAISGETAVVGSFSSAAYVFVKPASGWANMTQTAELTSRYRSKALGSAVAISDKTVIVAGRSGYVYVEPQTGWRNSTTRATLTGGAGVVAVDGNTAVSGEYASSPLSVFVKPKGGWKSTAQPNANLIVPYTFYEEPVSVAVSVSGNTIAVGTGQSFNSEGVVYVFVEPTGGWSGNLNPTAKLIALNGNVGNSLGASVAIYGNTVVAGAPGFNEDRGAVYVFQKPAAGWQDMFETAEITAPDSIYLGWSVAVTEDSILAGALGTTVGFNQLQGAAYLYTKPKNGWKTTHKFSAELTAADGMPGDQFGTSVALTGTTAVIGAPYATVGTNSFQGAAYVFVK
jgi:hypothetical protein